MLISTSFYSDTRLTIRSRVFAISLHTLMHLFLSKRPAAWVAPTIMLSGWFIVILLPIIGPHGIADKENP